MYPPVLERLCRSKLPVVVHGSPGKGSSVTRHVVASVPCGRCRLGTSCALDGMQQASQPGPALRQCRLWLQNAGRNIKLHLGRSSILVRDALRRPLLEAEVGSVAASLSQRSQHVSQVCESEASCTAALPAWPCLCMAWQPEMLPCLKLLRHGSMVHVLLVMV